MIKILFIDVDGTLTDGNIYIGAEGELFKAFNVKDGLGLKKLINAGILPILITGRKSKIVENRCKELGISELYQEVEDKKSLIENIVLKKGVSFENTAFIGDDENDLEAMKLCSLTFSPKDAAKKVKEYVDVVLTCKSGDAPVREAIEYILEKNEVNRID